MYTNVFLDCIVLLFMYSTIFFPLYGATSKTWTIPWTWSLKKPDPEKPGPCKSCTQKNLEPEKPRP